jgi:hypothetical protein
MEYLSSHPCVECGETDVRVLEFDHIEAGTKIRAVTTMLARGSSWAVILKEISKCEVVCANHHRIRTYERMGSYRDKFVQKV